MHLSMTTDHINHHSDYIIAATVLQQKIIHQVDTQQNTADKNYKIVI